jgi:hypothetical protein
MLGWNSSKQHTKNKNPHFWRMIPELESRRNAWLEFFKTAEDLGTDIFLSFKKSKALCKHGGGPRWLTIRGPELQIKKKIYITTG